MTTLQITIIVLLSITLLSSSVAYANPDLIAQLEIKIAELEAKINELKEDKQKKNAQISKQADKIAELKEEKQNKNAIIDKKDAKIDQLENKIVKLEDIIDRKNNKLDRRDASIENKNEKLDDMKAQLNSTSDTRPVVDSVPDPEPSDTPTTQTQTLHPWQMVPRTERLQFWNDDPNGQIQYHRYVDHDGNWGYKQWYEGGQLYRYTDGQGIRYAWHDNGQIWEIDTELTNPGVIIEWDVNGTVTLREVDKVKGDDIRIVNWYASGNVAKLDDRDRWYENGQMQFDYWNSGLVQVFQSWTEDGEPSSLTCKGPTHIKITCPDYIERKPAQVLPRLTPPVIDTSY